MHIHIHYFDRHLNIIILISFVTYDGAYAIFTSNKQKQCHRQKDETLHFKQFHKSSSCHTSRKECSELTGSSPSHFTIPMDIKSRPLWQNNFCI